MRANLSKSTSLITAKREKIPGPPRDSNFDSRRRRQGRGPEPEPSQGPMSYTKFLAATLK